MTGDDGGDDDPGQRVPARHPAEGPGARAGVDRRHPGERRRQQAGERAPRAWAARKIANVGAAAIAADATTARPAPRAASEEMSRTRVPRMRASDAAIATTAVTDRACPTAVIDEPRSWATEEIVGLRTTSIAWEPIAQSTSGDRRAGGVCTAIPITPVTSWHRICGDVMCRWRGAASEPPPKRPRVDVVGSPQAAGATGSGQPLRWRALAAGRAT